MDFYPLSLSLFSDSWTTAFVNTLQAVSICALEFDNIQAESPMSDTHIELTTVFTKQKKKTPSSILDSKQLHRLWRSKQHCFIRIEATFQS